MAQITNSYLVDYYDAQILLSNMTTPRYRRRTTDHLANGVGIGLGHSPPLTPTRLGRPKRRRIRRNHVDRALLIALLVNSLLAVLVISRYMPEQYQNHSKENGPLRQMSSQNGWEELARNSAPPKMVCAQPKSRAVVGGSSAVVIVDNMNFSSCDPTKDLQQPSESSEEEDYYAEENGYYKIKRNSLAADIVGMEGNDAFCRPAHKWQTTKYPNCNSFHDAVDDVALLSFLSYGSETDVFTAKGDNDSDRWVLKTNRYHLDLNEHQMELRRKEAVVLERLTQSQYVPSIYGHCGMSLLAPFANGGTLYDFIKSVRNGGPDLYDTSMDTLRIAVQLSEGLAALHSIDGVDIPSFAHNDLDPDQFVYNEEKTIYQINDFNFGKMIMTNKVTGESCKVHHSGMNMFKSRAPEDMAVSYYESGIPFDLAKADVFTLGTTLYMLLTRQWMWEGEAKKVSIERLIRGERPAFPNSIRESNDQALSAVAGAISACWKQDPEKRPTASEVANFLMQRLTALTAQDDDAQGSFNGNAMIKVQIPPPPLLEDIKNMDDDYDINM